MDRACGEAAVPPAAGSPAPSPLGLARPYGRSVRADLRPVVAHVGGVEAHGDDRVAAFGLGLFDHAVDYLLAAVDERLRHSLQLSAQDRLQARSDLGADVAGANGETEDLTQRLGDFVARQV